MKRNKALTCLFIIIIAFICFIVTACDGNQDYDFSIEYVDSSNAIKWRAPWAEKFALFVYYGDENGNLVYSESNISAKDSNRRLDEHVKLQGTYLVIMLAYAKDDKVFRKTLTFTIDDENDSEGNYSETQPPPSVEVAQNDVGLLKSVYYYKSDDGGDLVIKLANQSGVKSVVGAVDFHDDWNYDVDKNILQIKSQYLKKFSVGAKLALTIAYQDGRKSDVYLQIASVLPLDVIKGGISGTTAYSENKNGVITINPLLSFDLYLGYDGVLQKESSLGFLKEICIDGVKLPSMAYSCHSNEPKITFSYTHESIMKLSHGLHLFEIYTKYGRSEIWLNFNKGVEKYPQSVNIDYDGCYPDIYVNWTAIRNDADGYIVHIGDKEYSSAQYPQLFDGKKFNATGKINLFDEVKVTAIIDGKKYTSFVSDTLDIDIGNNAIQGYLSYGESFEFMGKKHNMFIYDFDEFKDMIYYALIYYANLPDSNCAGFEKALRFYVNPSFAGNAKEVESKLKSAVEILNEAVKYDCVVKGGYVNIYELHIKVYSTCIPDDVVRTSQIKENAVNNYHVSKFGRGSGYEDFAVNGYEKEAKVEYSEELYIALERGIRPLPKNGSSAERIYREAKSILSEIIDDGMDDYQKVHAMVDWLSCRVSYNWALGDEVLNVPSDSAEYDKFYAYREFYLEGVFIDKIAVCSGYAKALSLMCGIEGIKCFKVKGGSGSNGSISNRSYPQHAWNKVQIDGKWYIVDSTWANERYAYENDVTKEVLKHDTMFMTNSESENFAGGAHYEMYSGNYTGYYSGESYDVFANTFFTYGGNLYDMVIDSAYELEILLEYIAYSKGTQLAKNVYITIDVRCDESTLKQYFGEIASKGGTFFADYSVKTKYANGYGGMTSIVMKKN